MQHDAGAGGEERGRRRLDACRRACVVAGIIAIVALIAILRPPVVKWQRPWSVASSAGIAAKMEINERLGMIRKEGLRGSRRYPRLRNTWDYLHFAVPVTGLQMAYD